MFFIDLTFKPFLRPWKRMRCRKRVLASALRREERAFLPVRHAAKRRPGPFRDMHGNLRFIGRKP